MSPSSPRIGRPSEPREPATNPESTAASTPMMKTSEGHVSAPDDGDSEQGTKSSTTDLSNWTSDIVACLIACLALAAIAITLGTHDGRPLPDWRFGISINALVAIFGVIWKTAMISPVANAISQLKWIWFQRPRPLIHLLRFDEASRGAVGSMWFVGRLRGMHLAWVGAIICILALAMDPFVQQLVRYSNCPRIVDGETASLARSNIYVDNDVQADVNIANLDYGMQAALYNGVYNSYSEVRPACSSGNCTFLDFRTVAMCGGCVDVSSELDFDDKNSIFRWTLPSGVSLELPNDAGKVLVMNSTNYIANASPVIYQDIVSHTELITLTGLRKYANNESFNYAEYGFNINESALAMQCTLWPCVRTYSARVSLTEATQDVLATHNMSYNSTELTGGSFNAAPMPCLINGSYHDASSFQGYNASEVALEGTSPGLPPECIFTYGTTDGLISELTTFFAGHTSWGAYISVSEPAWLGQVFHNDSASFDTINQTWNNIADSMTAHMRRAGTRGTPARGTVWETDTCVSVQWGWLTYPAALLLLTVAFLAATIRRSRAHSPGQVWKASPLPLLFHGLDRPLRDRVGEAGSLADMRRLAARLVVSFQDDGDGGCFAGRLSSDEKHLHGAADAQDE